MSERQTELEKEARAFLQQGFADETVVQMLLKKDVPLVVAEQVVAIAREFITSRPLPVYFPPPPPPTLAVVEALPPRQNISDPPEQSFRERHILSFIGMAAGSGLLVAGILLSMASYQQALAKPYGGAYTIYYGLIFSGVATLLLGLYRYSGE